MLIDTHCHINMMIKNSFDTALLQEDFQKAKKIIDQAQEKNVTKILNVGTSLIESTNTIKLAESFKNVYSSIGIHPNDLTDNWQNELQELEKFIGYTQYKIVAIGETGIDLHYPNYNLKMQEDAFRAQIDLALKYDLAVVVHSRDAADETLNILKEYKNKNLRATIHCFSQDLKFATQAIELGFVLGIGGTITYPKNDILRNVVKSVGLEHIVLETDAPFLPIQANRGKQNNPTAIYDIALYIADLLNQPIEVIAQQTTANCNRIFKF